MSTICYFYSISSLGKGSASTPKVIYMMVMSLIILAPLMMGVHNEPSEQSLRRGLIGYWRLNEGEGDIIFDQTENHNHGTLKCNSKGCSPPKWVKGKMGYALEFDGVDDYVEVGNIGNPKQEFSLIVWSYRLGLTGKFGPLVIYLDQWSNIGGFTFGDFNNGWIGARLRNGFQNKTILQKVEDVPNEIWHHYAIIWNKPNFVIYLNGKKVNSKKWLYNVRWGNNPTLVIGAWSKMHFYNGNLDEIAFYKRALTEKEVETLYQRGGS